MKLLDLFSGIGGFSLGFESTGYFKTTKFVEMDKYCQKILKKNFPGIPIEEDIKNVKGKEFEADVITGGVPCQPFSVAGRQRGTSDDRYLWPEMFRLVKEIKPKWTIMENVQGLINIQDGMVLRQVQDDLEGEGFEVQCFLIPASGIGAWHQRKRVWIVGYSEHNGSLAAKKSRGNTETTTGTSQGKNETIQLKGTGGSRDNENVSNSENRRGKQTERQGRKSIRGGSDDRVWSKGERENIETNGRTQTNVPNTESFRGREPRDVNKEKGMEESISTQFNGSSENVSNSNSRFSIGENKEIQARGNTINSSSKDVSNTESKGSFSTSESKPSSEERTRLDINEKKNWSEIWSYASRCNEQVGSRKETIQHTNSERCEELNISQKSNGQNFISGKLNSTETIKTWWQTQSEFCGVPNGVSYELDKDRSSRIKALGNSIVPQIARQIALSIIYAEEEGR